RTPTPQASLISPAPFAAVPSLDQSVTAALEPSWVDSTPGATRLRHRSARSEGSHTGWVVGGSIVTLIGVATAFLLSRGNLTTYWQQVREWMPSRHATGSLADPRPISAPIDLPGDTTWSRPDSPASATRPQSAVPTTAVIRLGKPLPEGARVIVDTSEMQLSTGGLLPVAPGSHVLRVRAPGYRSAKRTIPTITAGDTVTLDLVLLPIPLSPAEASRLDTLTGAIVLKGELPSGSVIRIDGRVAIPGSRVLTVPPGPHWIAVAAPGYATDSSPVTVEQGSWSDWSIPVLKLLADTAGQTVGDSAPPPPPEPSNAELPGSDTASQPR
ncbi:MAG TPA: PEGA domain-containing protein, partial [Gemmatimonadales bacterium]|nr:PEGA domain-containing protein [Gemmatimonadales bacterium]